MIKHQLKVWWIAKYIDNLNIGSLVGGKLKSSTVAEVQNPIELISIYSATNEKEMFKTLSLNKTKSQAALTNTFNVNTTAALSSISDKKLSEIIQQLMKHNEVLSGQLQAAKTELNEKSASLNKMKKLK